MLPIAHSPPANNLAAVDIRVVPRLVLFPRLALLPRLVLFPANSFHRACKEREAGLKAPPT